MTELNRLPATELLDGLAGGTFTAGDIARDVLARIAKRDPLIHAWQYLSPGMVTQRADLLDSSDSSGLLQGIPVGIKDTMDTRDMPTRYGSTIYERHQPDADASVVALLRQAGANIIGKTVATELAYFLPGPTVNPADHACTPGGSSSGSAAAVADFMVPVAFGSQTAGSVTRPASYCGILGYKPSYGVHSLTGVKPLANSLDTLGWMARTVEDLALIRSALLGIEFNGIDAGPVDTPVIGLCRTWEWSAADQDSRDALESARSRFTAQGAIIRPVELPNIYSAAVEAQKTIMAFEVAQSLAPEWSDNRALLSDSILTLIEQGIACSVDDYVAAQVLANECRAGFDSIFERCDVLLTPSATGEAPEGHAGTGDPVFNRLWTLVHLPSISLPGYLGAHGRPVGVQLTGRKFEDENLLRIAHWCHRRLTA